MNQKTCASKLRSCAGEVLGREATATRYVEASLDGVGEELGPARWRVLWTLTAVDVEASHRHAWWVRLRLRYVYAAPHAKLLRVDAPCVSRTTPHSACWLCVCPSLAIPCLSSGFQLPVYRPHLHCFGPKGHASRPGRLAMRHRCRLSHGQPRGPGGGLAGAWRPSMGVVYARWPTSGRCPTDCGREKRL